MAENHDQVTRAKPTGYQAPQSLSVFLSGELGASVGDADVQLSGALYDVLALARGHVVGDLCRVFPAFESTIVHGMMGEARHTRKTIASEGGR